MGRVGQKVRNACGDVYSALARTKSLNTDQLQETELKRCLSIFDLVALGIGATLGAGTYIIIAPVARNQAGPAVVVSILIAALASLLAGICYAEFAARTPRAGSAYTYSYVSVGEGWAFVIGWNIVLEYIIGVASTAKALSQYFDYFFNDTIQRSIIENVGEMHATGIGKFPDFFACGLIILVTVVLSLGVKVSSVINSFLTMIALAVVALIIVVGIFYCEAENWTNSPGFMPYGFRGIMSGAATCFYAFIGFDVIAASGEEARNPTTSIPISIVLTLAICFGAYVGVSSVITLMVPFYELPSSVALMKIFAMRGLNGAEYIISLGAICGLSASLLGSFFPLPRIIYSMASDGLLFRVLGSINSKTNTPLLATLLFGVFAAGFALFVDLQSLVQMMSIGTLMAYTLVSTGVLILRYRKDEVGLTAMDTYEDIDSTGGSTGDKEVTSPTQPAVEGTGLLSVGNGIKSAQHAPERETTLLKRAEKDKNGLTYEQEQSGEMTTKSDTSLSESSSQTPDESYQEVAMKKFYCLFNAREEHSKEPTERTRQIANASIIGFVIVSVILWVLVVFGGDYVDHGEWWTILLIFLTVQSMLVMFTILARQPQNKTKLHFRVPLVPFIPVASVLVNIHLMISLSFATWMRFIVWMTLGAAIYFGYGMRHSSERDRSEDQEVILSNLPDGEHVLEDNE